MTNVKGWCLDCQGIHLPTARTTVGHFDVKHLTPWIAGKCKITLDTVDVTVGSFAGLSSPAGWVAVYSVDKTGAKYMCKKCGKEAAAEVRQGIVELTFTDPGVRWRHETTMRETTTR